MTQVGVLIGLGFTMALIASIALCVVVLPKSREGQFTGLMKVVRDFFLFRYLVIEAILRFFYILETLTCIFVGFFLLFGRVQYYFETQSTAGAGIAMILFGPICTRLIYELFMIPILQLKNVMEINAKIKGDSTGATAAFDLAPIATGLAGGLSPAGPGSMAAPMQRPVPPVPAPGPVPRPVEQPIPAPVSTPVEQPAPAAPFDPVPAESSPAPFDPIPPETSQVSFDPIPAPAESASEEPAAAPVTSEESDETASANAGRTCPNCGATVSPTANFCTTCGTKLD